MNDMHNFTQAKNKAINELLHMQNRATQSQDNKESVKQKAHPINHKKRPKNFGLSITDDELIIIGLLLILSEDCHDIWLFLSLIYILM